VFSCFLAYRSGRWPLLGKCIHTDAEFEQKTQKNGFFELKKGQN
jgi:hypothetical protein